MFLKTKSASENYQLFCAGCHGVNLDQFIDREWIYGKNPARIEQIIADGLENDAMPGYEAVLTNDEIRALGEYILAESKSRHIEKIVATNFQDGVYGNEFKYKAEVVVDDLEIPWGIEFLPNGDLLIAERNGTLSKFTTDQQLIKIEGLPEIRVAGQGGLMDLRLHPDYDKNNWIYITYSYVDVNDKRAGNTRLIRSKLKGNQLTDIEILYTGLPALNSNHHFGSRIAFDNEGYVYFSIGDRGRRDVFPQKLDNSNGKVHRLHADGSIPDDNPFYETGGAERSIFSYGHRNIQGIAKHPVTGEIWTHEHGPRGGDEINIVKAGLNYGWPEISFGINYDGTTFTNDTARVGMEQPLTYYVPSIAPCGMAFVTSKRYGDWENSLLIGSLRFQYLERCIIEDNKVVGHERLLEGIGRVREVKVSPDGYIYVGVEGPGRILKLIPVNE
ncbi:MAG: PQQ-dependent sugar dehydrogenase [Bacteroidales bacterium]